MGHYQKTHGLDNFFKELLSLEELRSDQSLQQDRAEEIKNTKNGLLIPAVKNLSSAHATTVGALKSYMDDYVFLSEGGGAWLLFFLSEGDFIQPTLSYTKRSFFSCFLSQKKNNGPKLKKKT